MTDIKTMANYLSFIYKYKSFIDDVSLNIVNNLNETIQKKKGNKQNPFTLDETPIFFNKKSVSFTGYYIKYKEYYPIYIGINYNLTKDFWNNNSKQYEIINTNEADYQKYFIGVDIKKSDNSNENFCNNHCKEVVDSKPIENTWEKDDDRWVYFNIPSYLLGNKVEFIERVVNIIKINLKVFNN